MNTLSALVLGATDVGLGLILWRHRRGEPHRLYTLTKRKMLIDIVIGLGALRMAVHAVEASGAARAALAMAALMCALLMCPVTIPPKRDSVS